jgi:hypothetical protein
MELPAVAAAERSSFWQDVVFDCLSAIISMTSILFINSHISYFNTEYRRQEKYNLLPIRT